jgi:metallo-beta-lactamase class B
MTNKYHCMKINFLALLLLLSSPAFTQLTLKLNSVPANTPAGATIHVAGNFQGWDPGDPSYALADNGNGTYQITITPAPGLLKFKFTRGSWATVEGNASGGFLPDREYNYAGGNTTLDLSVQSWEDLGGSSGSGTAADNVYLLADDFFMPQLNRNRRIWIYLPPDYESSDKRYPVIYMQDGQNLFDQATSFAGEWEVDESLNELFEQGDHGCIVVGIENGGNLRADEYAPWLNTNYNLGGEGGAYLDFIAQTLKPHVDANYRTLAGREYTCLFGSSLGALISHYGLVEHQDVFGKAGSFSPAYWFNPQVYDHSASTPKSGPVKLYFLAGIPEDNGSVVSAVNQMHGLMANNGYGELEMQRLFHADGQHSEWYWAREFPAAYLWLFAGMDFTAAAEESPSQQLFLFPNPADSTVQLKGAASLRRPQYQVMSLDGRLMKKGRLHDGGISISDLPAGMYVMRIISRKAEVYTQQLLIQR